MVLDLRHHFLLFPVQRLKWIIAIKCFKEVEHRIYLTVRSWQNSIKMNFYLLHLYIPCPFLAQLAVFETWFGHANLFIVLHKMMISIITYNINSWIIRNHCNHYLKVPSFWSSSAKYFLSFCSSRESTNFDSLPIERNIIWCVS